MRTGSFTARGSCQSQHSLHVVDAGFLADDPPGGAQGAVGEGLPAAGFVGQFQSFAVRGKDDGMVADDVAATQRVHANLVVGPFAGEPVAAVAKRLLELELPR